MMNKFYSVLITMCFIGTGVQAQSDQSHVKGYTASVFIGVNHVEPYSFTSKMLYPGEKGKSHFKNGTFLQVQLGKEMGKIWALELELERQSNDEDYSELAGRIIKKDGYWSATSSLLSLEVYPWEVYGIKPFFGIGTGVSFAKVKESVPNTAYYIDDSSSEILLQLSLGIGKKVSRNTSLKVKYEYNDDGHVHLENTNSVQPRAFINHVFAVGVTYHFSSSR